MKRGNYVIVEPIVEGFKVKAEIVKILTEESIKHYKENKVWPKKFDDNQRVDTKTDNEDWFVSRNRNHVIEYSSESDSSDDSDSDSGIDGESVK